MVLRCGEGRVGGWRVSVYAFRLCVYLEQAPAVEFVIRLEKNIAERRIAEWVVLEVELIEAAESGCVGVHAQRVQVEIVHRGAHLLQRLGGKGGRGGKA